MTFSRLFYFCWLGETLERVAGYVVPRCLQTCKISQCCPSPLSGAAEVQARNIFACESSRAESVFIVKNDLSRRPKQKRHPRSPPFQRKFDFIFPRDSRHLLCGTRDYKQAVRFAGAQMPQAACGAVPTRDLMLSRRSSNTPAMKSILGIAIALCVAAAFGFAYWLSARPGASWLDGQWLFLVALPYNWASLHALGAADFSPDETASVAAAFVFDVVAAFLAGAIVEALARWIWRI